MSREEYEKYVADKEGNSYREIDSLRAQEGVKGLGTKNGLENIGSADTGTVQLLFSRPTHATRMWVKSVTGFNSVGSGANTLTLYDVVLGSGGSITSQTQRSVPLNVSSGSTQTFNYDGDAFSHHVGVSSEFQGQIGVAVISEHQESDEPAESV